MNNSKATYRKGIITINIGKKPSSGYKKYLDDMLTSHFGDQGMTVLKEITEDGSTKWIIGSDESISKMVDESLNI